MAQFLNPMNAIPQLLLLTSLISGAPHLPAPSGPFAVGRVAYDLTDASRPEVLSADPKAHREFMMYVWYPAERASQAAKPGAYFPGAREIDQAPGTQEIRDDFENLWPLVVSGAIDPHVQEDAPVTPGPARFPVVLFSHGLGGSSFEYTALIEDLVRRGYVVAAVEHTYEANAVAFPGGRIIPYSGEIVRQMQVPKGASFDDWAPKLLAAAQERADIKAADLLFALDKLSRLNTAGDAEAPFTGRLDLTRVAAAGHSAGASVAARACQLDRRIKACIDADGGGYPFGAFLNGHQAPSPRQPFLFLEVYRPPMKMDPAKWNAFLARTDEQLRDCPGGSYHVTLKSPGMVHGSFSDEPLLMAGSDDAARKAALHNLRLIEEVDGAFLDKYLKGEKAPLLDGAGASAEITVTRNGR